MLHKLLFIMTLLGISVNARASSSGGTGIPPIVVTTGKYVKQWVNFPPLALKEIESGDALTREVTKGRIQLVVFVASWCIPCQQIIDDMERVHAKHKDKYTDLIYVFAHDTEKDALAFARYHKIEAKSYLGTAKVLEDFHQPELPSIYGSDRYGWLAYRKLSAKEQDVTELDTFLIKHSAF